MKRWLEGTPRGDSTDSIWLRLRTWRLVAASLPTVLRHAPFGRRPLGEDLRQYIARTGASVHADHCFNEYLQVIYEYGLLGLVALGVAGVLVYRAADWHSPFGTALAIWALTMNGSITLRTWPFPVVGALLLLGALWP